MSPLLLKMLQVVWILILLLGQDFYKKVKNWGLSGEVGAPKRAPSTRVRLKCQSKWRNNKIFNHVSLMLDCLNVASQRVMGSLGQLRLAGTNTRVKFYIAGKGRNFIARKRRRTRGSMTVWKFCDLRFFTNSSNILELRPLVGRALKQKYWPLLVPGMEKNQIKSFKSQKNLLQILSLSSASASKVIYSFYDVSNQKDSWFLLIFILIPL